MQVFFENIVDKDLNDSLLTLERGSVNLLLKRMS